MDECRNAQTQHRIRLEIVSQVFGRASIAVIGTMINAVILTFVLWGRTAHNALATWLALTLVTTALRYIFIKRFQQTADPTRNIDRWERWLVIGLGFSGFLWGASAIFLFPLDSTAHQAFIAFSIAGMVAGAVGVFSAIMAAFLAFSIPALLPVAIRFMLIGDTVHLAMAFMTVLFALLTFATAKHINEGTRELVTLKETFSDQLAHRTAELQRLNAQYKEEINERKKTEAALQTSEARIEKALQEKTMLLQEIHHRVKNNMQVIISLMHLQASQLKDVKLTLCFKEASSRVNAMALIHNILYESNSIAEVRLSDYFKRLADSLLRIYNAPGVQISIKADGCHLSMDQAIPCGLILNELISNSLKHAFRGLSGHIRIEAFPCERDRYVVVVQDNGVGLPDDVDLHHASTLGLKLVSGLAVQQLGGQIDIDRSTQGTSFRLQFKDQNGFPSPHALLSDGGNTHTT